MDSLSSLANFWKSKYGLTATLAHLVSENALLLLSFARALDTFYPALPKKPTFEFGRASLYLDHLDRLFRLLRHNARALHFTFTLLVHVYGGVLRFFSFSTPVTTTKRGYRSCKFFECIYFCGKEKREKRLVLNNVELVGTFVGNRKSLPCFC